MYTQHEINAAKKRVKAKKEFYKHLMAFVVVNFFLFLLNMLTSPLNWWFHFPMLGWGIGLMFHYVDVFGIPGFDVLSKEWEERELDAELRKQRGDHFPMLEEEKAGDEEEMELKELRKNFDESEFV